MGILSRGDTVQQDLVTFLFKIEGPAVGACIMNIFLEDFPKFLE